MAKRVDDFEVIENKVLTDDLFVLELQGDQVMRESLPGQFVQVLVEGSPNTFLRRPISVFDLDIPKNTFKLLIQKVGHGTEKLSELRPGDRLNMICPLGNSFSQPEKGETVLLAGGGVGIAPLLFLGKRLKETGFAPDYLLGFRNKSRVPDLEDFRNIGKILLTTEDGSLGEKGYITDHTVLREKRYDRIYCCGPDPMMKAVAAYSRANGINCEVSLENLMACGFGICLCCIVSTVEGNVCTCTDGPVFNIRDLKW